VAIDTPFLYFVLTKINMTNKKDTIRHAVSATSTRHGALEIKPHASPPMRIFEGEGLADPKDRSRFWAGLKDYPARTSYRMELRNE
jgi:hypothetical protein